MLNQVVNNVLHPNTTALQIKPTSLLVKPAAPMRNVKMANAKLVLTTLHFVPLAFHNTTGRTAMNALNVGYHFSPME
jgi:hypothetical protein